MAVGNDPGSNFTVVVVPTVRETGPGDFCFGDLTIPGNLNISEGTNATLQVISGGGDEGGLYGVCTFHTFVILSTLCCVYIYI